MKQKQQQDNQIIITMIVQCSLSVYIHLHQCKGTIRREKKERKKGLNNNKTITNITVRKDQLMMYIINK